MAGPRAGGGGRVCVCVITVLSLQTPETETPLPVSPDKRGGREFTDGLEMVMFCPHPLTDALPSIVPSQTLLIDHAP